MDPAVVAATAKLRALAHQDKATEEEHLEAGVIGTPPVAVVEPGRQASLVIPQAMVGREVLAPTAASLEHRCSTAAAAVEASFKQVWGVLEVPAEGVRVRILVRTTQPPERLTLAAAAVAVQPMHQIAPKLVGQALWLCAMQAHRPPQVEQPQQELAQLPATPFTPSHRLVAVPSASPAWLLPSPARSAAVTN